MAELNKLQAKVLQELWYHPSRRFSDLMSVTGLTSDDFKFHLRKLVKFGYVTKNDAGVYELTAEGKEFANRFDYDNQAPLRQPKMTTAIYLRRVSAETGAIEYLFHQRLRQPFYEYWGVVGRPVRWGESFEYAAQQGLMEQIGLSAPLSLKGFYRQLDMSNDSAAVLEDKLFVVFEAEWQGDEPRNWPYARAKWMTIDEMTKQSKRFDSCVEMLTRLQTGSLWFLSNQTTYDSDEF